MNVCSVLGVSLVYKEVDVVFCAQDVIIFFMVHKMCHF